MTRHLRKTDAEEQEESRKSLHNGDSLVIESLLVIGACWFPPLVTRAGSPASPLSSSDIEIDSPFFNH